MSQTIEELEKEIEGMEKSLREDDIEMADLILQLEFINKRIEVMEK